MKGTTKKCPNGHYYTGNYCPWCRVGQSGESGQSDSATKVQITSQQPMHGPSVGGGETQEVSGERIQITKTWGGAPEVPVPHSNHTILDGIKESVQEGKRMLVGWLVSYTLDSMGVDYRLYQGKNQISRERGDIVVPKKNVSAPHAEILYRNGQFAIRDLGSSNGTYVNGVDIGFDFYVLHDNDEICLGRENIEGQTSVTFIFKTAIK